MQSNSYRIVSYKIKHGYDINDFLLSYRSLLQRAIDTIWDNIKWVERRQRRYYAVEHEGRRMRRYYYVRRLIPTIPKSKEFKKQLRDELLKNWSYASHYVDSAIKTAYSILNSWRRNYVKGRRKRRKPTVRRLFVRVKETLYVYRDGRIRVTIAPRKYLEFDLTKAWFRSRVEGLDLGELILTENELVVTFRRVERKNYAERIGWDLNLFSLDGFSPNYGWIRIDLSKLYHVHRVHEVKRKKAQSVASKKPSLRKKVRRHSCRERNRSRDFAHKLTAELARAFPNAVHGFEDLNKSGMFNHSRKHNREVSKQNWEQIVQYISYKSRVELVDPKYTSTTCPMCGGKTKLRKGRVVRCTKCGLELDRQLCGAINVYLKMCGFPRSPSNFFRLVLRPLLRSMKRRRVALMKALGGVTTNGGKGDDMPPMNSIGWLSLMNPKAYTGLQTTM